MSKHYTVSRMSVQGPTETHTHYRIKDNENRIYAISLYIVLGRMSITEERYSRALERYIYVCYMLTVSEPDLCEYNQCTDCQIAPQTIYRVSIYRFVKNELIPRINNN